MQTENWQDLPQNNESEMEARLWAYIDGISEEAPLVEKLVAEQKAWREKYAELLQVHQVVQEATELEQPSLRFTKNVMEEIARLQIAPAAKEYINQRIIWGLAAFFILMLAGCLVYGFAQVNWQAATDASSPFGVDFGQLDFSKMFSGSLTNLFILLNVVAGLLLLDRILAGKRKKWMRA